jgi:LSD1 subclass zinc finger protein
MPIQVRCPNLSCGKPLSLPDDQAGKSIKCSFCQQAFDVPPAEGPTAQPSVQSAIPPKADPPIRLADRNPQS